jgi:hypothetical protein
VTVSSGAPTADSDLKAGRDWLPYAVAGLTILVLFTFLLFPIGKTMLLSFVPKDAEIAIANLTFENFA